MKASFAVLIFLLMTALSAIASAEEKQKLALGVDKDPCRTRDNMRLQIEASSLNLKNLNTTRTANGGSYLRKEMICKAQYCVVVSRADFVWKHAPEHPDADQEGNLRLPKINPDKESALLKDAQKHFEMATRACNRLRALKQQSESLLQ
ncbi:hypothetical protein [Pseudobdellovibrio exovorus]|uniref:Uncharacterized protein n=1 Tax=Pseudobdellovibrio exovorus JSS TaxID=1184267 RepID=M4V513_9BACT|nr:hypothetical protein [Pseudobdellovibrio exovorus]AGH94427.1 hypothetical protein A11Q_207 [Pseudobdellovibrio exovorus JSS]